MASLYGDKICNVMIILYFLSFYVKLMESQASRKMSLPVIRNVMFHGGYSDS